MTFNLGKKYYPVGKFVLETEPGNIQNSFSKVKLKGKEIEQVITHEDLQKGEKLEFLINNHWKHSKNKFIKTLFVFQKQLIQKSNVWII